MSDQHNPPMQATAHLPGLKIDVLHQRSPDGGAEQISINLQAVPSFEAFSRYMENVNPLVLWVQLAQMAWFPWLQASRTAMLPWQSPLEPKSITSDSRPSWTGDRS